MTKLFKTYIKEKKYTFILITFISLFLWICSLIMPYLNALLIDSLTGLKHLNIILKIIYTIIILSLLNLILSYILNIQTVKLKAKLTYNIIYDLTEHLKKVYILFFSNYEPVYLTQRIQSDSNALMTFFVDNYLNIFINFGTILFSLFMLYIINIKIFIVSIISIPLYITLYNILRKPLYKWNLILKESQNKFLTSLSEQFTYIKNIKTNSNFNKSANRLTLSFENLFKNLIDSSRVSNLFFSLDGIITLFLQASILIIGTKSILNKEMTIGQFTSILSYYSMAIGCIKYYLDFGKCYQETKVSFNRVMELYDVKKEHNGVQVLSDINSVTLENVDFSYTYNDKTEPLVLENLNFNFKKSNIYLIQGHNGSGKSTLINIIIGLLVKSNNGIIKYNEKEIKEIDLYDLRYKNIAVVSQNPIFISDNVISLFDYDIDYEKTIKFIKKDIQELGLTSLFYNDLFSLDEYWFKNTTELSGGETQKIAILQAFLKRPQLLILDEPSSSLDSLSVNNLIDAISFNKLNMITLIITHDDRFITISDEIVNLNN